MSTAAETSPRRSTTFRATSAQATLPNAKRSRLGDRVLELEAALGRAHLRIQELEKALYRPNAASQMSAASSGNSGLNTSSDSSEEGAVTLLIGDEPHLGQSPAAGDGQETAVVEFQLNGSGEKI